MQAPPPEGAFLYVAFFAQFKESDKAGLMYYNARYYDPRLGRFITADSEIPDPGSTQSFNRYMYVLGNPVRYNDPSGHEDSDGPGAASPASPFAPNAPGHFNSGGGSGGGYYNVPYTRYEVSPVKNGTFNYGINIKAVKTIRSVNYEHNSENINPANETSDCSGAKSISKEINHSVKNKAISSFNFAQINGVDLPFAHNTIFKMTSPFDERDNPTDPGREFHNGIDLGAPDGTPVYATEDGVCKLRFDTGVFKGYGNSIKIINEKGDYSLYGHLSRFNITQNQNVRSGDLIGYVGSTGRSTGMHLHYGVNINGGWQNPLKIK